MGRQEVRLDRQPVPVHAAHRRRKADRDPGAAHLVADQGLPDRPGQVRLRLPLPGHHDPAHRLHAGLDHGRARLDLVEVRLDRDDLTVELHRGLPRRQRRSHRCDIRSHPVRTDQNTVFITLNPEKN